MSVVYRLARMEDLERSGELVVCSMNELCERHGFDPIATVRPPAFSLFSLSDDPDGLWVAKGELLELSFSAARISPADRSLTACRHGLATVPAGLGSVDGHRPDRRRT
jgi:hypothetical protein